MKKLIINSIFIFLISVLIHSLYDFLPNIVTLIFVPINESIFEHTKMIFTSYVILLILKRLFMKKHENNDITSTFITAVFNIIIFLIIYLPIYYILGEKIVVTLIIYFITIVISNILKNYIEKKDHNNKLNNLMIIPIIVMYIIFFILAYYPLRLDIFYDHINNKHGIYKLYK